MTYQYRIAILLSKIIALEFFMLAIVCNNSVLSVASLLESIGCSTLSVYMLSDANEVIP